jgi:dolichol-phosphate mannosyltransferase
MHKACIVIPTHNEAENIGRLLPQIFSQAETITSHELHVLVVDDESKDGTADVVGELAKTYPNLHLISGKKNGLGDAYKRGMQHARRTLDPDLVLQMDADLQHDPALLPVFISLGNQGFDLVIGSRFAAGGSTPNFSIYRRFLSLFGNWLLRVVGGMPPIRDCTSGYRCIKASLLRKCNFARLSTRGYSFQSSLLSELVRNEAKVIEVPMEFAERRNGASKLRMKDQFEFLANILRIRLRQHEEFIRFCMVGTSGVVVNMGIYALMTRMVGLPMEIASIQAIETSILWNFTMNSVFTFKKRKTGSNLLSRFLRFHVAAGLAGIVNYSVLLLLVDQFGMWDIAANLCGINAAVLVNYHLNSRWTWKEGAEANMAPVSGSSKALPAE